MINNFEEEKTRLTPKTGFALVGIDCFADTGEQLYLIEHFEKYQEALNAKKDRDNQDEYFVLYRAGNEFFCR